MLKPSVILLAEPIEDWLMMALWRAWPGVQGFSLLRSHSNLPHFLFRSRG